MMSKRLDHRLYMSVRTARQYLSRIEGITSDDLDDFGEDEVNFVTEVIEDVLAELSSALARIPNLSDVPLDVLPHVRHLLTEATIHHNERVEQAAAHDRRIVV